MIYWEQKVQERKVVLLTFLLDSKKCYFILYLHSEPFIGDRTDYIKI